MHPEPLTPSHTQPTLYERYGKVVSQSYPQFLEKLGLSAPAVRAEGALITDADNRTYIDGTSGYGIYNIGHNHPALLEALEAQLREHRLNTRPLLTEISVKVAEELSGIMPGGDSFVFLCNSGSEAVDSALKLARLCRGKKRILSATNAFHGFTFGALSVTGIPAFKKLFEPLLPEVHQVPYNDIAALKTALTPDTAAVILEPMQHEAGVIVPEPDYLQEARRLCDEEGALLIVDEIVSGCGRSGRMLACEHAGVVPDMVLLGKSLGGGMVPVGALLAKRSLFKKFSMSFSMSASSYAGNTLACCAVLATLGILRSGNMISEAGRKGALALEALRDCGRRHNGLVVSVSGRGLLIGIEMANAQAAVTVAKNMVHDGVIALPAYGRPAVLMIEPPLVITDEQLRQVCNAFDRACSSAS